MKFCGSFWSSLIVIGLLSAGVAAAEEFVTEIQPLLNQFCVDCHSGDEPSGKVDLSSVKTEEQVDLLFDVWAKAVELVQSGKMPPEDETQPTAEQKAKLVDWYQNRFIDSVVAKPGNYRPRRLSATEYRNTLRSLFGFDLEVAIIEAQQTRVEKSLVLKLLPTDPPGRSGFRNDTHGNPLTTNIWDQYSHLVDAALAEYFSPAQRENLAASCGEIPDDGFSKQNVAQLIRSFVPRAVRRDVDDRKMSQIIEAICASFDLESATRVEIKAILMSPQFMFRGLLMQRINGKQQPVDNFELAERLSYFIWADMPDDELFELARLGELSKADVLKQQVKRMMASPQAENFVTDFSIQWLALDEIDQVSNNPPFAIALKSQPIDFMNYLFREDRPLLEFIDSEVTFTNPLTRRFYGRDSNQMSVYRKPKGIEIETVPNQKIVLKETVGRGGILTIPGVLAMNRGPVIRGTWMLERILGEHLPDPPADVGQVQPNRRGENLTFRERFEMHRSRATCAVCHDKIDPLGFALQAYDAGGGLQQNANVQAPKKGNNRSKTQTNVRIDCSGKLPSGETFEDFEGLKTILVTSQRKKVIRQIVDRTMSYALCRKLEFYDQPTINQIVEKLASNNGTYHDLVLEIVNSLPFRETYVAGDKR